MKSRPVPIRSHLLPDLLQQLGRELDTLSRLKLVWSRCLSAPLADHSWPRHFEAGLLTIAVRSSAWASRLRQQQSAVIERLRREPGMTGLRELRIRIVPKGESDPAAELRVLSEQRRRPTRLSPQSARLLREVADRVTDPDLSAALNRLADRAAEGSASSGHPSPTGRRRS